MIQRHPIVSPLYGIGIPAWVGLAAAGPLGALLLGLLASIVFAWRWP